MGNMALLTYGFSIIMSTLYPDLRTMWIKAVLCIVLGAMVAAGVAILVGFLVLPSLASDEVRQCCTYLSTHHEWPSKGSLLARLLNPARCDFNHTRPAASRTVQPHP
jgi:hypothetical protein